MSELNGYEVLRGTITGASEFLTTDVTDPLCFRTRAESDPNGKSAHEPGSKLDAGKCLAGVLHDFSLALQAVANVGDMGAKKYTRGGWQTVPEGSTRYFDAMWRHLLKSRHEELDPDSGLPHLDHMAWNLIAIIELRERTKAGV